jgi:hypothetical protein
MTIPFFVSYFYSTNNRLMKTKLLLLFLFLQASITTITAQQLYSTQQGDLAISITDHDTIRLMVSNEMLLTLDYETSKISLKVGYETFRTHVDSLDDKLRAMKGTYLEYTGKLGISINTRNYGPQKYNMEGVLTTGYTPVTLQGNGSMTCMPAGDYATPACMLLVSLQTTLSVLHLNQIFTGAEEGVRIDVRQSILKKIGD